MSIADIDAVSVASSVAPTVLDSESEASEVHVVEPPLAPEQKTSQEVLRELLLAIPNMARKVEATQEIHSISLEFCQAGRDAQVHSESYIDNYLAYCNMRGFKIGITSLPA